MEEEKNNGRDSGPSPEAVRDPPPKKPYHKSTYQQFEYLIKIKKSRFEKLWKSKPVNVNIPEIMKRN